MNKNDLTILILLAAAFLGGFCAGKYYEQRQRDRIVIDGPGWSVDYFKPKPR